MNNPNDQLSSQQHLHCLIALVIGLSVATTSSGLSWPLLSESLRLLGYNEKAIGLSAAAQFAGNMFAALLAPKLIPRFGFYNCTIFGVALAACVLLALPMVRHYELWILLRFLLGAGHSLVFTTGDNWVNQVVEDRVRGRWMGIYTTANLMAWTIGPVLGSVLDPQSLTPFVVGVASLVVAAAFLVPARRLDVNLAHEAEHSSGGTQMFKVIWVAPVVLLSAAIIGIVEGGLHSFGHLYTMDVVGSEYRTVGLHRDLGRCGKRYVLPVPRRLARRQVQPRLAVGYLRRRGRIDDCLAAADRWWRSQSLVDTCRSRLLDCAVLVGRRHGCHRYRRYHTSG